MIRVFILSIFLCCFLSAFSQTSTVRPKVMVIPFTKDGEDIRTVLDKDVNGRIAITKVKEGFDNKGYSTVDFVGKLKAAKDNQIFTSDNQTDIKTRIIEMSGADIYIVVEVSIVQDNSGTAVSVILSGYDASTGNSVANKVGSSGKFFTDDISKLTGKAVDKCIDDSMKEVDNRFLEIENTGRSVLVDISFAEGSEHNMTSPIGADKLALSDVLEDWFSKNAVNNSYHIQGTTDLKMIFDDVKIPVRDANGNNYTSNKYGLLIFNFLKSLGLSAAKQIKSNTIYIQIN